MRADEGTLVAQAVSVHKKPTQKNEVTNRLHFFVGFFAPSGLFVRPTCYFQAFDFTSSPTHSRLFHLVTAPLAASYITTHIFQNFYFDTFKFAHITNYEFKHNSIIFQKTSKKLKNTTKKTSQSRCFLFFKDYSSLFCSASILAISAVYFAMSFLSSSFLAFKTPYIFSRSGYLSSFFFITSSQC